ncbi:MAG TPA: ATP-binding protein, partial [Bryobacteraceae bacterium]|nr:ATP-binding protein [Bryobacteraceae bacterium]
NSQQKNAEAALLRAKDAAVSSNVAKTRFLAKIGHEIRTPLNAILGSADLLAETMLTADQAEYVNIFRRNSRRLVGLINDFLDFSKIEAGAVRVDKVPFRIRQTLYEVVDTFRDVASRKGLTLDCQADPGVPEWQLGDAHRLQQVLTNLVSNAMKFTYAGRVEIHASIARRAEQSRLRFQVSDTGPGIRPADREKIFSPFTQLKDPAMPTQGTGLGLTICRELVQLMDGSIGVESQEGIGSTFYFELPLEQVDAPAPQRLGSKLGGGNRPEVVTDREPALPADRTVRILVAEDTADNRLLIQAYLKAQPVRLRFAENGQEVMRALSAGEVFDLILMDLDMPNVDGCTAARWVRAWQTQKKIPPTPIVALSAHAMHDMVRASLDAGCIAHVAKPVDRRTLLETILRYAQPGLPRESYEARQAAVSEEVAGLVPNYLASQAKHIQEAREQLRRRDFDSIQRFGHNLKGTGRGYGFPEIETLGRELEHAANENREPGIAENLEALDRFVSGASAQGAGTPRVA